jgi:hypothetical protein
MITLFFGGKPHEITFSTPPWQSVKISRHSIHVQMFFCIKKIFLTKLLDGVSVEFLFRKNQSDAILVFGRHFGFSSTIDFFQKKFNIFELKSIYRTKNLYSLIFAKILKIKGQKPAILDCGAILKDLKD